MLVVIVLVAVAAMLMVGKAYVPLIQKNEQMRRRIETLDTELRKQQQGNKQLLTELDALRHDPKTVERLARETLAYARTNETVFHFDPATNPPPGR